MSDYSGSDGSFSSSGRAQSSQNQYILNPHKLLIFSIVPSLVVQKLPQQLNRRLGKELLLFGHIKIIHKHDVFLTNWRSINSSFYLLQFQINRILSLVNGCLSTESDRDILVILSHVEG